MLISADSFEVGFLDTLEGVKITLCHGFDDEVLVLAEEEKASAFALRLSCLKNSLHVLLGKQAIS